MAAVSCKFDQSTNIQGTRLRNNITRRDTLSFMSAAMLVAFLVVAPAEARTSRLENKKKSMEKLKKIREKALARKEKDGRSAMDMPPANLFADHLFVPPPVVIAL